jgi:hypothetical protein
LSILDDNFVPTDQSNYEQQAGHAAEPSGVSRDDVSKEITMPTGAAVARPRVGPGLHPETKNNGIATPIWRPQQGNDARRRRRNSTRKNLAGAFAQSNEPPLQPLVTDDQPVTEPPKIIMYYRLSLFTWPLSNNKELLCRFCRIKPNESLTTGSRYALSPHEGGTRVHHYIT